MTKTSNSASRYWCVVPAAGIGSRAKADIPKQYLKLGDKTILEHTLNRLLQITAIEKIIVALHSQDTWWSTLSVATHPNIETVQGGEERQHSVTNALTHIQARANKDDWVLVHDAARPCITPADVNNLIQTVGDHSVGGLLGTPVSDTIKHVVNNNVVATTDRSQLWSALTPQMFRFNLLYDAHIQLNKTGEIITDEAMAIEKSGHKPVMVEGSKQNIKVTLSDDIELANFILDKQQL